MTVWHIHHRDMEVKQLASGDPMMGKLISYIGDIEVELRTDYFTSIVRSIIGQLISVKAADTIYSRFVQLMQGNVTATAVCRYTADELRAIGLTKRKASYIHSFAEKNVNWELDLRQLKNMTNEDVVKQLTSLKGIGNWTAEMFLIFSLGRKDVLALDDIGLQRGAKWLYQVPQNQRHSILSEKSKLWQGHYTIASFYLWESVLQNLVSQPHTIEALMK